MALGCNLCKNMFNYLLGGIISPIRIQAMVEFLQVFDDSMIQLLQEISIFSITKIGVKKIHALIFV
jgi:hypothetical protein